MTEQQVQQVIDMMIDIGGMLAREGFEITMTHVIFDAVSTIVVSVFFLIPFIYLFFKGNYYLDIHKRVESGELDKDDVFTFYNYYDDEYLIFGIGSKIVSIIMVPILLFVPILHNIKVLLIPEWYTILEIASMIK